MSFILDALRKSENERQIEAVPDVMRVPLSVEKTRLPIWAGATIGMLTIGLVAVLAVWWSGRPTMDAAPPLVEMARPAEVEAAPDAVLPPPEPVHDDAGRATAPPSAPPAEASIASERVPEPQPVERAVAAATPELATEPAPGADPESAADAYLGLPGVAELVADGVSLPNLELQLLVNSSNPASRFVMINGNRYVSGDRLAEGPELVAITAQGAVLRYAQREFLLAAN